MKSWKTSTPTKVIGKGEFTTCYKQSKRTCLLVSTCYVKEAFAIGWMPTLVSLSPKIIFAPEYDSLNSKGTYYKMPYYKVQRAVLPHLDNHNKKLYRTLRKIHLSTTGFAEKSDFIGKGLTKLQEAYFCDSLEVLRNYSKEIKFEISPRNVATKNGKLILLDVWFIR